MGKIIRISRSAGFFEFIIAAMMMLSEQIADSRLPAQLTAPMAEIPLATFGEYTMHPMEFCTEDQIAKLFTRVCQRGNPVLAGRPFADLELLGRAMYRKSNILRLGQVAVHKGQPVALSCCWDAAEGGVWAGSGLEMPASLAAHAACGKECFAQLPKRGKKTFFAAFYGVDIPHNGQLFGYLGMSSFVMANALGFEDTFQYTLLPTLTGRGLFTEQDKDEADTINWPTRFADVPTADPAVSAELTELGGNINLSLTRLGYALEPEYMKMAAATVRMQTGDELLRPSQLMGMNHLKWLQQTQSRNIITSRL